MPSESTVDTDLCIIGAGAAGITLAREFIGSSVRVALLESGGEGFDSQTQSLYEGPVTGLPYFPLDTPRLRYFGGTTNHWAGVCRPFDNADFESREWVPFSGWPITVTDLDAYYPRAQEVVQLTSDQWDTAGWVGRDRYAPLPLLGDRVLTRVDQIVPPDKRRFSDLYGDELKAATNVTVYLEANVTEVQIDEVGTAATGVSVATLTGNRFAVSARVIVLAVGGIDNARLLLASNSWFPNGIGNQNDLVGRFFLEHPRFVAGVVAPTDPNLSIAFYQEHIVDGTIIQPRLAISRETQEAEGLADVQIRIDPVHDAALERAANSADVEHLKALRDALQGKGAGDIGQDISNVVSDLMTWHRFTVPGAPIPIPYPDVMGTVMRATPREKQSLIPGLLGDIAGFLYTRVEGNLPLDSLLLTARFEPAPNPESRVTLVRELDEVGMPRAELDWQLSASDRHAVRRSMEIVGAEFGSAGLGRVRILFEEEGSEWPADLAGGFHHMGTTRMSDDPKQGVVDRDCRVHGMSNLYVAGSSVFTTGGSSNPTMLIVALALRLADRLREEVS
ncbi:MAG: GMC family oxidoreductase [Actinomycetota bacterium]